MRWGEAHSSSSLRNCSHIFTDLEGHSCGPDVVGEFEKAEACPGCSGAGPAEGTEDMPQSPAEKAGWPQGGRAPPAQAPAPAPATH